jgi:hypothetical protein
MAAAQPDTASTLRKLHELKIDQSFVRELPGDPSTENTLRQARCRVVRRAAPAARASGGSGPFEPRRGSSLRFFASSGGALFRRPAT